jgi:hypothetical protein
VPFLRSNPVFDGLILKHISYLIALQGFDAFGDI